MVSNRPEMVGVSLKVPNFAFTSFVLLLTFNFADSNLGSFTARARSGYDIDLNGPNYTDIGNGNHSFNYSEYDPMGMGGFYNMATSFLDLIAPEQFFPEGFVKVVNGKLIVRDELEPMLSHYSALLAFVIILLIVGILTPLCGLFFCCCRCCGNCGANPKPLDKNGDLGTKIGLATALIVLGTLLLIGVISAFVSNEQLQKGTVELPNNAKVALREIDGYIDSTANQVKILLNNNYKELEAVLITNLDDCSVIVADQLNELSNATTLTEVVNIVDSLDDIQSNLTFMYTVTQEMPATAKNLARDLKNTQDSLKTTLQECPMQECKDMLTDYVNKLGTDGNFELPDISGKIKELNDVLNSNIINDVKEGKVKLDEIQTTIKNQIDTEIINVKRSIDEAGKQIVAGGSDISSVLRDLGRMLEESVEKPLEKFGGYLEEYSVYRYYPELAVCLFLLVVVLCIVLGLIFGVFCKHPAPNGDNCCDKTVGSCFLMIGVGMMFFIAFILVLAIILHVSVGIFGQKVVCDTFREPNNSQVAKLISEIIKGNGNDGIGIDIDLNGVLGSCNQNLSFYNVFELENLFNIDELLTYLDKFNITKMLDELIGNIRPNTNITLLSKNAEEELVKLANSGIADINFTQFIDEFDTNITSIDLDFVAGKLDELNGILQNQSVSGVQDKLTESAKNLREYQAKYVLPMMATAKETRVVAKNLMEGLKFGKESFKVAITSLIDEVKQAQEFLQNEGLDSLTNIAREFARDIEALIRSYLDRVIGNTKKNVGRCGPLSASVNSTLIATCDKMLLPWNGFWFSLFWCFVFFIPTLICSIALGTMYKKSSQFQGLQTKRPQFENKKPQKAYGHDASRHQSAPYGRLVVPKVVPYGVGPPALRRDFR